MVYLRGQRTPVVQCLGGVEVAVRDRAGVVATAVVVVVVLAAV